MITGITIENFKGIGQRQEIIIRPLTLLFGPNSAGKSTILHSLHYAREILSRHNLDADTTESGGTFVDLGGYLNLLHRDGVLNHDKDLYLRFDLDLRSTNLLQLVPIDEFFLPLKRAGEVDYDKLDLSTIGDDIASASVEITVAWSLRRVCPFVKRYAVSLNGEPFAEILGHAEWADANFIDNINLRHPLFAWNQVNDVTQFASAGILDTLYPSLRPPIFEMYFSEDDFVQSSNLPSEATHRRLLTDASPTVDPQTIRHVRRQERASGREFSLELGRVDSTVNFVVGAAWFSKSVWSESEAREALLQELEQLEQEQSLRIIPTQGLRDALPPLDVTLTLTLAAPEDDAAASLDYHSVFRQIVDRLLRGPGLVLREALARYRYLGPLRSAVPRNHTPSRFPDPRAWPSGDAAWDALCRDPDDLCLNVSTWLSDDDKLDTGYLIRVEQYREISVESRLWGLLCSGRLIDNVDTDELQQMLGSLRGGKRLILTNIRSGTDLQPKDVGEGITQMIPVIVAVLDPAGGGNSRSGGLVGIEQPELHLNPRQQAALGDLLIAAALEDPRNTLLIETHSQPLILRILKRMRATATSDNKPHVEVHPEDISVWYVDNEEGTTEFIEIRIGKAGEFLQEWPDFFFDQAFLERFG